MIFADVFAALRARFAPPEWALFPEVRGGNGWTENSGDSADAVAMNLWPSGGLEVHGFEIKVSRGDWLRELKDPTKTNGVRRFCDRWWLAVSDAAIVKPGELPAGWGLIVACGKARIAVRAPKLAADPLDRAFIASMLRAGHEAQKVEERQAQKAALVAAPLRPVVDRVGGRLTLSCGHVVVRTPSWRLPKAVRCLECGTNKSAADVAEKDSP